jgi:hypothetical protein
MSHTPRTTRDTDVRSRDRQDSRTGTSTVAIVCGVLGTLAGALSMMGMLPLMLGLIGLVLAVAGLIVGSTTWSRARDEHASGAGAAMAGAGLSALALVLSVVGIVQVGADMQRLDDALTQLQQEGSDVAEGDVGTEDLDPDAITD